METKQRLFLCLPPPESLRERIGSCTLRVPDALGVRFEPPERLHVTLRFLGEVPSAALDAVIDASASVAAAARSIQAGPLLLSALRIEVMSGKVPRVWLRFAEDARFGSLALALRTDLDTHPGLLGLLHAETHAPPAHLTLARGGNLAQASVKSALEHAFCFEQGEPPFAFERMELWRSKLTAAGPAYALVEAFALS